MTGVSFAKEAAVSFRDDCYGGKEMTKRILSMLLASLILISAVPMPVRAAAGQYTVSLASDSEGKTLSAGDSATVTVQVSGNEDTVTGYNAYDFKLSYDTQYLAFVSGTAADSGAEITEADGRIRVKGYGDTKDFSTAAVTLTFKAKAPGKADVSVTHAKVEMSDRAGLYNAPEAALVDKNVKITIDGFEVVVNGEGVVVDSYVATSGEDYVFSLADHKGYTYTLKVTIGGVDLTSKVTYNEETGEYTIPKELIDRKIEITATVSEAKAYVVTITGSDVTGEKTAEYNTDYTFKLDREEDYIYTIQVTIGGEEYTGYTVEENVYTIPGADILGDIKIKVTKQMDYSNKAFIDFIGTGAKDGSGEKVTDKGVEYPFKIKRKKGYTYSVRVLVDGKRTSYDYDYELDTYYILAENVTGNITIVIGKVATVEVTEYVTLDEQSLYLIVYNGIVGEGQVPKYDGRSMYWSDRYNAYVWLIVSDGTDKKVKKAAESVITLSEGTAVGTIDYSGNVNRTLQTDSADAQLAREMYEGRHSLDFMEMQKLLSADVYSDKKLNVRDVAAIASSVS